MHCATGVCLWLVLALGKTVLAASNLEARLDETAGLEKARLLAELAESYKRSDAKKASAYALEALAIEKTAPDMEVATIAWSALAWVLMNQAEYDKAHEHAELALDKARFLGKADLLGRVHYTLGAIEVNRGSVALALRSFKRAAENYEKTDNAAMISRSYSAIGSCYRRFGEFEQALGWQEKAYGIAEELNDPQILSSSINNLGVLYYDLGQPENALKYYLKSIEYNNAEDFNLVIKYNNVGDIYRSLGQFDKAFETYHLSLALNQKLGFAHHEAEILQEIGATHLASNELPQALRWLNRALDSAEKSQVAVQKSRILVSLSKTYQAGESYDQAIEVAEQARMIAASQEEQLPYLEALQQLASSYKAAGRFEQALETFELYSAVNEKMLAERSKNRLAEIQSSLDTQIREREIVQLQQEKTIRELQLEQERTQRYVWLGGVIMLMSVIGLLVKRYARVKKFSRTDILTNIPNRSFISECLTRELNFYKRNGREFCVLLLDVDDFKDINDNYGHNCGDQILQEVAKCASACIRASDRLGRWGGEEFLVVFPETTLSEAEQISERIRRTIAEREFKVRPDASAESNKLHITLTGGLCQVTSADSCISTLITRADKALYRGKDMGKNQVLVAS